MVAVSLMLSLHETQLPDCDVAFKGGGVCGDNGRVEGAVFRGDGAGYARESDSISF